MSQIGILILVTAIMFTVLGLISLLAHIYNLNNIKNKTVGQGQHGTARWATKSEIARTYTHVPYTPELWRKKNSQPPEPTKTDKKGNVIKEPTLPQGIIVGCNSSKLGTTALIDTGDVHALMIGAAGVGKTTYWLYPNLGATRS
jgi:type IV secretion system protein VirD4